MSRVSSVNGRVADVTFERSHFKSCRHGSKEALERPIAVLNTSGRRAVYLRASAGRRMTFLAHSQCFESYLIDE